MKKILFFMFCATMSFACTDEPIPIKVESVVLDQDEISLIVDESVELNAIVLPDKAENKTLYWTSSKNSVALVNDGIVTAISPGFAVITVISDDGGKKASCNVKVNAKPIVVTGITLDKEEIRVFKGKEFSLIAEVAPSDATNKTILWKSADETIATVHDGVVKGVSNGITKITAETEDGGFIAECSVKVTEECQTQSKGPMTLDLGRVTATTAVISGSLDIELLSEYDMSGGGVGFIYAPVSKELEISTATKVQISNVDSENSFSRVLEGLKYDSEYHYTIFLYKNGICQYGEIQRFKTDDISISITGVAVTNTTATISGECTREDIDSDVKVGIMYSTNSNFNTNSTTSVNILPSEGGYSIQLNNLKINTTYYYRSFICQNNVYEYGEISTFTLETASVVLSVSSKSQTTVVFSGSLIPSTLLDEVSVGILIDTGGYPSDNDYDKKISLAPQDLMDGKFEVTFDGLLFNKKYYYRYYILNNGTYVYGDVQSFTTDDVPVSISVDYNKDNVVRLKGNVGFSEKGAVEMSFQYCQESRFDENPSVISTIPIKDISENGDFEIELSGLMPGISYCYRYVLSQGDNEYVSDTKVFETDNPYASDALSMDFAEDLSSHDMANCYIVSKSGTYKFRCGRNQYPHKVTVLWESFGTSVAPQPRDLIKSVNCEGDDIVFQTSDDFKEGNAVIAALNSYGQIIWSWHIWMTDIPSEQVYYNGAGIMMDRNLGATSATPGDVGALGLLYQWGRKDPFLGASSISEEIEAKSTIEWSQRVMTSMFCGNIDYTIHNPTVFIGGSGGDWLYSERIQRWTSDKSEYDPCPPGWRIPDGGEDGIWEKASGAHTLTLEFYSINKGVNFSGIYGEDDNIWYPATGARWYHLPNDVGTYGYYWSTSYRTGYNVTCYVLDIDSDGDIYNRMGVQYLAFGCPVRCQKE